MYSRLVGWSSCFAVYLEQIPNSFWKPLWSLFQSFCIWCEKAQFYVWAHRDTFDKLFRSRFVAFSSTFCRRHYSRSGPKSQQTDPRGYTISSVVLPQEGGTERKRCFNFVGHTEAKSYSYLFGEIRLWGLLMHGGEKPCLWGPFDPFDQLWKLNFSLTFLIFYFLNSLNLWELKVFYCSQLQFDPKYRDANENWWKTCQFLLFYFSTKPS